MKRAAIAVLVLAALAFAGHRNRETLRLSWIAVSGRSPHCPFSHAIRATTHSEHLVATKDRILAASRLVEEDPNGLALWETPYGPFWIPAVARYTLPFNLAEEELGIYSSPEVPIRPGDIVLDCGANVGVYARAALEAGASLVVAIEPLPVNIECLRLNFSSEIDSGRLIVYPKGVWDSDDVLTLHVNPANTADASFVTSPSPSAIEMMLPLTTIDKLAAELNLPRVDLIKMDIEGSEPRALRGAAQTLARHQPRLAISAYHAEDHPALIPQIVTEIQPAYRMVCGPCTETETGIRPDTLLFH